MKVVTIHAYYHNIESEKIFSDIFLSDNLCYAMLSNTCLRATISKEKLVGNEFKDLQDINLDFLQIRSGMGTHSTCDDKPVSPNLLFVISTHFFLTATSSSRSDDVTFVKLSQLSAPAG